MNVAALEAPNGDGPPSDMSVSADGDAGGAPRIFKSRRAVVEPTSEPAAATGAASASDTTDGAGDSPQPARAPRLLRMPDGSFASASGSSDAGSGPAESRKYGTRAVLSRPGGPPRAGGGKEAPVLGKDGKPRRKDRQDDNVLFGKNAATARRSARASRKARGRPLRVVACPCDLSTAAAPAHYGQRKSASPFMGLNSLSLEADGQPWLIHLSG